MGIIQKLDQLYKVVTSGQDIAPPRPDIGTIVEKNYTFVQSCLQGIKLEWLELDGTYYMIDQNHFLNVILYDWVDKKDYVAEKFDCEDFAFNFKAHVNWYFGLNQVGMVIDYSSAHGYNIVVFPTGNVMLFEPQNDSLFFLTERDKEWYAMTDGFILL